MSEPNDLALARHQVESDPTNPACLLDLSERLLHLGQDDEALLFARRALAILTSDQSSCLNRALHQVATVLYAQKRHDDSLHVLMQCHQYEADISVQELMAANYLKLGFPLRAADIFIWCLNKRPTAAIMQNAMLALSESMRVDEALELYHCFREQLNAPASALSNALMLSHYSPRHHEYVGRLRPLVRRHFPGQTFEHDKNPFSQSAEDQPLRVGFISADLCSHPVGFFCWSWLPSFAEHAWVVIYDQGSNKDVINKTIRESAQCYRSIQALGDRELYQQIVADNLDVLVDLSGHTAGNRLLVLAKKPAPVLVNYLGYFSSTFVDAYDAVIMDEAHMSSVPADYFQEKVYFLPNARFCYKSPDFVLPVNLLPAKSNQHIVFACFANTSKFTDQCIRLWSLALHTVPRSRLRLKWRTLKETALREQIWQMFEAMGIHRSRIELYVDGDHRSLFFDYQQVDVALDTYPFSSATTSCEALSMGVPVLTCCGDYPAANQTSAILQALGLSDWVVSDPGKYGNVIYRLLLDLESLEVLRLNLPVKMRQSALADAGAFARDFEGTLRRIYHDAI